MSPLRNMYLSVTFACQGLLLRKWKSTPKARFVLGDRQGGKPELPLVTYIGSTSELQEAERKYEGVVHL